MIDYTVEPKSRNDLRELAEVFRKTLRLENSLYFPIVQMLDILPEVFSDFSYEIVPDYVLPKQCHAQTDIKTGHITIKESVYDGACSGNGRDRMTIAHEIGHYFMLCVQGFKLQRNFSNAVPSYKNPEWQAKCFAGELMIPKKLVKNMNPFMIAKVCGVSSEAAFYQSKKYKGA